MLESWGSRIVAVIGLLAVLFGLMVGFGMLTPAPELGAYPGEDELAADGSALTGEYVQVGGTVIETDPVVMELDYDYYADGERHRGEIEVTVQGVDRAVQAGQFVKVYGQVESGRTISVDRVVVVPPRNYAYMYTVSFLAGLWVLGRLIRGWRLDWATGALYPRGRADSARTDEVESRPEVVE